MPPILLLLPPGVPGMPGVPGAPALARGPAAAWVPLPHRPTLPAGVTPVCWHARWRRATWWRRLVGRGIPTTLALAPVGACGAAGWELVLATSPGASGAAEVPGAPARWVISGVTTADLPAALERAPVPIPARVAWAVVHAAGAVARARARDRARGR